MTKHTITIEQVRHIVVDVDAETREQAEQLAAEAMPEVYFKERNGARFAYGTSQILPPLSEFNADHNVDSVEEGLAYIRGQRDPFDCLFRYIKHHCYWGEHGFAWELLRAAHDIVENQQGEGY